MKKYLLPFAVMMIFHGQPVLADQFMRSDSTGAPAGSGGENLKKLVEYVKNLGLYLGFDVEKKPQENANDLLNIPNRPEMLLNLVNSFLGAIPVASQNDTADLFLPKDSQLAQAINPLANETFKIPASSTSKPASGALTVNYLIDQAKYQFDPVSQSIYNILTTPDMTYCMAGDKWDTNARGSKARNSDCAYLYHGQVLMNILGDLPKDFFSQEFNQPVISQLNTNSLIAPLLYSSENLQPPQNSGNNNANNKLTAANQQQQAANFIRYAIADVTPISLASFKSYDDIFTKATNRYQNTPLIEQKRAQLVLGDYLTKLRVFAAQRSVAISNLYDIFSKRMPQTVQSNGKNEQQTSEALSEFTMAAWRLKNLDDPSKNNDAWLKQINKASSATVQKEMAVLLAEINYQLYLSRQQQERILLTNSMILMQNMKDAVPTIDKSKEEVQSSSELK